MVTSEAKKQYMRAWRAENPDKVKAARARQRGSITVKERMSKWRRDNRVRLNEYDKRWRQEHPGRTYDNPTTKKGYRSRNRGAYAAYAAKRRSMRLQATPAWANLKEIQAFYAECPEGMDVDHEVPLSGGIVCGLHVLSNLRHLPHIENVRRPRIYSDG